MILLNSIDLITATRGKLAYLDISIDGKLLAHHFAGRLDAHPSQISALGWQSSSAEAKASLVSMLLSEKPSALASGRIPVLVCEECGDVGCGAYAVRILREGDHVRWTDWSYENGHEPARPVDWPTKPADFLFDRQLYEQVLRMAL
jgi:hypothetical protein